MLYATREHKMHFRGILGWIFFHRVILDYFILSAENLINAPAYNFRFLHHVTLTYYL